jgi:hypothetical protein
VARSCTPSQQLESVCCSRSWPSRLVGGEADSDRSRVAEPVPAAARARPPATNRCRALPRSPSGWPSRGKLTLGAFACLGRYLAVLQWTMPDGALV